MASLRDWPFPSSRKGGKKWAAAHARGSISDRDLGKLMTSLQSLLLCSVLTMAASSMVAQASNEIAPPTPAVGQALPSPGDDHDVTTGVLIHAENPKFPPGISKKKARGQVTLHATITIDGTVKDPTVLRGDPLLIGPAIEAVRQWRFVPRIQNGIPVESHSVIEVGSLGGISFPEGPASDVPREPQEDVIQEMVRGELFQLMCHCVTFPRALYSPNPEYSEAARKTKFEGDVLLGVVVDTDGKPRSVWIVLPLGRGLDEKALEAAHQWRFQPATKDGKPVAVVINLGLRFQLR